MKLTDCAQTETQKRLNPHVYKSFGPLKPTLQGNRIRQASKAPNKWEQEWIDLVSLWPEHIVMPHSIKFKLASGCWYEPDVMLWHTENKSLTAYEVKGFARDDAVVKLKVAARAYPWIEFWLVWKENGAWKYQKVLP